MTERIIVVDGVDGSGKSTVLVTVAALCAERAPGGIFDVIAFEKANGRLPTLGELGGAGVLSLAEPTYSPPTGTAIRDGALRPDAVVPVQEEARLFAEDRARLYGTLVLPFLARRPDGWVVQSRGLIASLAYQAPRWPGADLETGLREVLAFPGNLLELEHAPRHLFLLDLRVDEAAARLAARGEALDRFEGDGSLQRRVYDAYRDPRIQAPIRARGTRVTVIAASNDKSREAVAQEAAAALADL